VVEALADPEVFGRALAAGAAGHRVFADTAPAFRVLTPASVAPAGGDSPGHPRFLAFPNAGYHASPSNSDETAGKESFHSSTGVHTSYGLCNVSSIPGQHQNRNLEHCYNRPNRGHNMVSDTNGLPTNATRSHPRRTGPRLYREQRIHLPYQASLLHPGAPEMRWAVATRKHRRRRRVVSRNLHRVGREQLHIPSITSMLMQVQLVLFSSGTYLPFIISTPYLSQCRSRMERSVFHDSLSGFSASIEQYSCQGNLSLVN